MSLIPGVGGVTNFWRVLREIDPSTIVDEAEQLVSFNVVGQAGSGRKTIASALAGEPASITSDAWRALHVVTIGDDGELPQVVPIANLSLYVLDATRGLSAADRTPARHLSSRGRRVLYVVNKMDQVPHPASTMMEAREALRLEPTDEVVFVTATDPASVKQNLIPAILKMLPDRTLALARTFPLLRDEVADRLITDTSRINGEFALMSSLPANIPLIGGVLSVGTDMLVLTKNQAMLVFKLAAVYGQGLESRTQLAVEIAPVVGAAFAWRSMARTLVGLLPGVVSAVPKTAIAFAGTYVVGRSAQYYYRWGKRPPAELTRRFAEEAKQILMQRFRKLLIGRQ